MPPQRVVSEAAEGIMFQEGDRDPLARLENSAQPSVKRASHN